MQKSLHEREMGSKEAQKLNTSMVAEDEMIYNAVEVIREMEEEMQKASSRLEFEKAAHLRDPNQGAQKEGGYRGVRPTTEISGRLPNSRKEEVTRIVVFTGGLFWG